MQITKGAVSDVNNNTPKGTHYDHGELTDPAKNIQCGSYYVDLRIKRVGGDVKKGLEQFGTGPGYADNILTCETCMKAKSQPGSPDELKPCLVDIHR